MVRVVGLIGGSERGFDLAISIARFTELVNEELERQGRTSDLIRISMMLHDFRIITSYGSGEAISDFSVIEKIWDSGQWKVTPADEG